MITNKQGGLTMRVPFKTPLDYFIEALGGDVENINKFPQIQKNLGWEHYDCDLHIYPYVSAVSGILSMGCKNQCYFCPTAKFFKGKVYYGDPEIILPNYENKNVHFMDEDFFNNDMTIVLPLLKKYKINWLAMATYKTFKAQLEQWGEEYLFDCGCRCVEMGLENVALMKKAGDDIQLDLIEAYYLNISFLPKETKETLIANAEWMKSRSLKKPIHFNNGIWYSPGQFYYPYGEEKHDGIILESDYARTRPTFIPSSLLNQDYEIIDLEKVNYYSQLVFGKKFYPALSGNIRELISNNSDIAFWLAVGIRCGGII